MTIVERNLSIALVRPTLDGLPDAALPAGYSATWYAPGDQRDWVRIHVHADRYNTITQAVFEQAFGSDPALLARRQLYLRDARGAAIGTASAWFGDDRGDTAVGRVHWVAIEPEHQGRGLAKPLLAIVCRRLAELGHQSAYLDTSTARIPAVNLYRAFGFVPKLISPADAEVWRELAPYLKAPLAIPGL